MCRANTFVKSSTLIDWRVQDFAPVRREKTRSAATAKNDSPTCPNELITKHPAPSDTTQQQLAMRLRMATGGRHWSGTARPGFDSSTPGILQGNYGSQPYMLDMREAMANNHSSSIPREPLSRKRAGPAHMYMLQPSVQSSWHSQTRTPNEAGTGRCIADGLTTPKLQHHTAAPPRTRQPHTYKKKVEPYMHKRTKQTVFDQRSHFEFTPPSPTIDTDLFRHTLCSSCITSHRVLWPDSVLWRHMYIHMCTRFQTGH